MNHVQQVLRQLTLHPGPSLVVILMLALGIGATTAMFSLFHQILVQPLPVPEPERLVNLGEPFPKYGPVQCGSAPMGDCGLVFSYPTFRDLEAQQTVFTGIAAHYGFDANLTYGTQALSGRGMLVSGNYFQVLGLEAERGRLIGPQDEPRVDEAPVVVLSHDYWRSRFGADPAVIGQALTVNGQSLTIIGIAPAGFAGTVVGWRPQVFVPLTLRWLMQPTVSRDQETRNSYWLYLFARLNPGVTVEQASATLNGLYSGIVRELELPTYTSLPDEEVQRILQRQILFEPGARGRSSIAEAAARPLALLLGVTVLVLLIVCVNIANLLLARGASRAGEMAIRASVGASRGRLVSHLLIESVVLAATGGIASLPVAAATLSGIMAMLPAELGAGLAVELSVPALLFAAGAALATVLLFGLAPAWQTSDVDPGHVMKGQASQASSGRGSARFRTALSTAQIALSMVLLVLAGLFAQSLMNVARVNLGIDADSLVSFSVSPRLSGYSVEQGDALYDRLEEVLAAQPGVTSAASALIRLISGGGNTFQVSGEGFEWQPGVDNSARHNSVSPGFFRTVSMPLLAGRDFADTDTASSPNVAIVNETFVRRFDLGDAPGDAVGERFSIPFVIDDIEIVGVVSDAKYHEVKGDVPPQLFLPRRQTGDFSTLHYYVRGSIDADALMRMIQRVVADIDPTLPVNELITMERQVQENVYLDRLIAMLSAGFAALATLLAAIGLYGVLAYNVTRRTRELGLRLALGAEPAGLQAMVLKQVAVMALIGGAIGLAAATGLGRAAEALLFGLSGHDPLVLALATAVLTAVVFTASWLPARRASNIAPMEALRHE